MTRANLALAALETDLGSDLGLKLQNAQAVKELTSRAGALGASSGNTDTTFVGRVTKISNSSLKTATAASTDQAVDYEVTVQLINPIAMQSAPAPASGPSRKTARLGCARLIGVV